MAQGQATKIKKKKKSVLKRAAQYRQRAGVNQVNRTQVRTAIKRLRTALTAGDATAAGICCSRRCRRSIMRSRRACCMRTPRTGISRG